MADADLNELRAQRRKARAALARAEAALGELRTANDIMESAINRLLKRPKDASLRRMSASGTVH